MSVYGVRTQEGLGWTFEPGPYPFPVRNGLGQLGFDVTDLTGGFSGQTVLLIGAAGLLLWLMFSSGGKRELEYRATVTAAKSKGNEAKRRIDGKIKELDVLAGQYRKTGVTEDVSAMGEIAAQLQAAEEILR